MKWTLSCIGAAPGSGKRGEESISPNWELGYRYISSDPWFLVTSLDDVFAQAVAVIAARIRSPTDSKAKEVRERRRG